MGKRLVKCIVCSAVFDEGIDICPVCGVGREFFILYEEEKRTYQKDTNETYVILGNGVAGLTAADSIRDINATCNIIMISSEGVLAYNRPMLTKNLTNLKSIDDILIYDEKWYEERNISNILNLVVKSIDTKEKVIEFENGDTIDYDKCIYALGATNNIPPIKGANKERVIAIRSFLDVVKVNNYMKDSKNVIVIGGGVLGLEAAWALSKQANVTILEIADKFMFKQLDEKASDLLEDIIKSKNINYKLSANILEITGESTARGVLLDTKEELQADLIIISAGISPNTDVAKAAGINVERGVIVNEKMETNIRDIYACGDCAKHLDTSYGIWPEAMAMGKIAGANAAGDNLVYEAMPPNLTFDGMDTSLFAAGDTGKKDISYKYVEVFDTCKLHLEKYYFNEEKLVGSILIGDTKKMKEVLDDLKEKRSYNKMFK